MQAYYSDAQCFSLNQNPNNFISRINVKILVNAQIELLYSKDKNYNSGGATKTVGSGVGRGKCKFYPYKNGGSFSHAKGVGTTSFGVVSRQMLEILAILKGGGAKFSYFVAPPPPPSI